MNREVMDVEDPDFEDAQSSDTDTSGQDESGTDATQSSETDASGQADERGTPPDWDRWDQRTEELRDMRQKQEEQEARLAEAQAYLEHKDLYENGRATLEKLSSNPELAEQVMSVARQYEQGRRQMIDEADPVTKQLLETTQRLEQRLDEREKQSSAAEFVGQLEGRFNNLVAEKKIPDNMRNLYEEVVIARLPQNGSFDLKKVDEVFSDVHNQFSNLVPASDEPAVPPSGGSGAESVISPSTQEEPTTQAGMISNLTDMLKNGTLFPNRAQ